MNMKTSNLIEELRKEFELNDEETEIVKQILGV